MNLSWARHLLGADRSGKMGLSCSSSKLLTQAVQSMLRPIVPALNRPPRRHLVDIVPEGSAIPRFVHQTFSTKRLPPEIQTNIESIKGANPGWRYFLYDDSDISRFVDTEYGAAVLRRLESINPLYGAARADLFRYLLLYKKGGLYLDIKSAATRPLDEVLRPEDRYLLSTWDNCHGGAFEGSGIASGTSRYRRRRISAVVRRGGAGPSIPEGGDRVGPPEHRRLQPGTPRDRQAGRAEADGTDRLHPRDLTAAGLAPHRRVDSAAELGLRYTIYDNAGLHAYKSLFTAHYANSDESIVRLGPARRWLADLMLATKRGIRAAGLATSPKR